MKKRLIAAAIAAMLCTATAHAQWVVVDPTNLVQNTLTAIRTLEQINNQIQQLQNEAQMLMNQARNLASLPSSVVGHLRANLATTERLIAQAQGLAYDVTNLDREFHAPVSRAVRRHRQRRPDVPRRAGALAEHAPRLANHHADAGPGVAEPGRRRKRAGRSRGQEPVGRRRAASDAGHESVAGLAGQAVDPVAAASDHARSRCRAGAGAASGGHGARARGDGGASWASGTPYTPQSVHFYGH